MAANRRSVAGGAAEAVSEGGRYYQGNSQQASPESKPEAEIPEVNPFAGFPDINVLSGEQAFLTYEQGVSDKEVQQTIEFNRNIAVQETMSGINAKVAQAENSYYKQQFTDVDDNGDEVVTKAVGSFKGFTNYMGNFYTNLFQEAERDINDAEIIRRLNIAGGKFAAEKFNAWSKTERNGLINESIIAAQNTVDNMANVVRLNPADFSNYNVGFNALLASMKSQLTAKEYAEFETKAKDAFYSSYAQGIIDQHPEKGEAGIGALKVGNGATLANVLKTSAFQNVLRYAQQRQHEFKANEAHDAQKRDLADKLADKETFLKMKGDMQAGLIPTEESQLETLDITNPIIRQTARNWIISQKNKKNKEQKDVLQTQDDLNNGRSLIAKSREAINKTFEVELQNAIDPNTGQVSADRVIELASAYKSARFPLDGFTQRVATAFANPNANPDETFLYAAAVNNFEGTNLNAGLGDKNLAFAYAINFDDRTQSSIGFKGLPADQKRLIIDNARQDTIDLPPAVFKSRQDAYKQNFKKTDKFNAAKGNINKSTRFIFRRDFTYPSDKASAIGAQIRVFDRLNELGAYENSKYKKFVKDAGVINERQNGIGEDHVNGETEIVYGSWEVMYPDERVSQHVAQKNKFLKMYLNEVNQPEYKEFNKANNLNMSPSDKEGYVRCDYNGKVQDYKVYTRSVSENPQQRYLFIKMENGLQTPLRLFRKMNGKILLNDRAATYTHGAF